MATSAAPPDAVEPSSSSRPRRTYVWDAVLTTSVSVVLAALAWERRWIADDGLIVTRTVRQLLAGNGAVFNAGERVEANTSTLWTYLLVVVGWVTGRDIGLLAVLSGLVLSVLGLAVAVLSARRLHGPGVRVVPLGALVVLALPPFWDFATSGLETGLVFCWLALAFATLVRVSSSSPAAAITAAVLLGLGPLVRPELAVVSAVFLLALWWMRGPSLRQGLLLLGAAVALPLAYQVFRMGYYGMLVPQTAVAKEAGSALWERGADYAADLARPYALALPVVLAAVAALPLLGRRGTVRTKLLVLAPWLAALVLLLYVLRVGGDFMHGRMLLPPLFLGLLPVMVVPWGRVAVLAVPTAVWALVCASTLRTDYSSSTPPIDEATEISDERAYWTERVGDENPVTSAPYVDSFTDAEDVRAARPSGAVWPGRDGDLPVRQDLPWDLVVVMPIDGIAGSLARLDEAALDPLGLTYPLAAHAELGEQGRPGHEKVLPEAFIAADVVAPSGLLEDDDVTLAREVLSCGPVAEMQDAVRAPLTPERFWQNFAGAAGRTTFRIPLDPAAAVRTFCSAGETSAAAPTG